MTAMTHEEAIAKAVKLLKLAQSDNPHESALAASRAQEIMDRYKLTGLSADLDPSKPVEPDEPIVNFSEPLDAKQASTWVARLALALARGNQCRIYTMNSQLYIIGRPSDVEAVRYLYAYLKNEINRLAARDGRGYGAVWKNNFRLGATDTVTQKLKEAQEATKRAVQHEAEGKNHHAIVLVQNALVKLEQRSKEVDLWVQSHMRFKKGAHRGGQNDYGAREAGQRAGHEININRPSHQLGGAQKQLK